jgi:hypothetical protein
VRVVPVVPAGEPAPGFEVLGALLADVLSFFFASFRTYLLEPAAGEAVSAAARQPTNVCSSADAPARGSCPAGLDGCCAATVIAAHANAASVIELSFQFIAPPQFGVFEPREIARDTPPPYLRFLREAPWVS